MKIYALLAAVLLLLPQVGATSASLLAEDIVNDAAIIVGNPDGSQETQVFTLVRDARQEDQWYYFPNEPRLSEKSINGNRVPEFNLIRYTYPGSGGTVKSRGLLTFSVTTSAPPGALELLKQYLQSWLSEQGRASKSVRLSPIPMNSANATVYAPTTGELIATGEANSVLSATGGTNANSKVVFALDLTDVGADVYDELTNGRSGIPVFIDYTYNGLTPAGGFSVTADWDLAYEHYSKNERFRARASYYGLFDANYESDRQYVRDELLKSGAIKIDAVTSENFTQETLDIYLQPILTRLNDEILADRTPPTKIDPAVANRPDAGGRFGGVGYSVSIKDVMLVRKGKETFDFSSRSIVERAGRADGGVSLSSYPEGIRKAAFVPLRAGEWDKVVYVLPRIPRSVDQATLRLRLASKESLVHESYYNYTEQRGWQNNRGEPVLSGVEVSLLGLDFDRRNAHWTTRFDVSVGDDTVSAEVSDPLEGVNSGLYVPSEVVRVLRVTARGLDFESARDDAPQLFQVDLQLSDGLRLKNYSFLQETDGPTEDLVWPVPRTRGNQAVPVSARVVFQFLNHEQCSLSIGPEKFERLFPGSTISLRTVYHECRL